MSIRFSDMNAPQIFSQAILETTDIGSDGRLGKTVTLYLDHDSIQIRNDNFPFHERHHIPVQMGGKRFTLQLHFNNRWVYYSPEYVLNSQGKALVEIPETFELANILLMLSPAGQKAGNMVQNGKYHDEVVAYFKPWLGHPVFKAFDVPEASYIQNYYEFRENSICYQFNGDKLVPSQYIFVYGSDDSTYANAFRNNVGLVEDFARQSRFRDFYRQHLPYYQQLIERQSAWSDVPGMQRWLGRQLPVAKAFDTSKLIFSPIILEAHSTQRFGEYYESKKLYEEMVLFVCGPGTNDAGTDLNDLQRRGLLAGIIFTEVDHNYVNPRSEYFEAEIDSIFSNREFWAPDSRSGFYSKPIFVFNEYMTHALFSLYAMDTFDEPTARFLIERREAMNAQRRGFVKFREFNAALMKLKKENADTTVSALYPKIIDWCRSFAN